jgi:hypothetical protein
MIASFFYALGTPFRALGSAEGRRAWALMLMAGSNVMMTAYVSAVLWIVRKNPQYAFYLGLGGFFMIAIVTTGFAGLLVSRAIDLDALGVKLKISDQQMQQLADKVATAVPTPPVPPAPPPPTVVVQTGPTTAP